MSNSPEAIKCGAKTRSGGTCQRPPMVGRTRCDKHGGKSLRGIEHPNYKHGIFSRHLPPSMGEAAWEAANDPDLFNMRQIIGVYSARLQHLFQLLGNRTPSAERMQEIITKWRSLREAQANKRLGTMNLLAQELDELTAEMEHDGFLWKEIDVAAKNYKLLLESERKRQIEAQQLMPVLKVADFARELLSAVRAEMDPDSWGRVQNRVLDIMNNYRSVIDADEQRGQSDDN